MQTPSFPLPKRILTIAGSEAGGTAGLQADLKTFQEIGVYGMTVITAMVGQHPKTKQNVHPIDLEAIEAQFFAAHQRTGVDAVKTGMLFSQDVIVKVAELLARESYTSIVVDPVMVGKLGKLDAKLLKDEAIEALKEKIFPLASLIMPNMLEASFLLHESPVQTIKDMKEAAVKLHRMGPKNVLVKGGRLDGYATDVLFDGQSFWLFETPRIPTLNTSGAGDTVSAAATAFLAQEYSMVKSIEKAKQFVTQAIAHSFSYQKKVGPVNQFANRSGKQLQLKVIQEKA